MINYKKLNTWNKGMDIVRNIYSVVENFPKKETYGLSSQITRAAVSLPSNIAEGCYRKNIKETIQFLYIAQASAAELETQLIIATNLGYIKKEVSETLLDTVNHFLKMNISFINHLKNK